MRASDPAQREELLERMLFLVEAEARILGAEGAAGESRSASLWEPQPPAIASPTTEGPSPTPNRETKPKNPA